MGFNECNEIETYLWQQSYRGMCPLQQFVMITDKEGETFHMSAPKVTKGFILPEFFEFSWLRL